MNQEKIGKFIAENRKIKKLTQRELAEKLGVTDRSVSKWENGNCMPDMSLLVPLCKELDISVNDLLSGKKVDKEEYQETFEKNIVSIVSKVDKSNKKKKLKNICISLSIIFLIIPLLVLCVGQFLKVDFFPSFSSLKIMNKANQFYNALQNNDIDKIDKLMTNNVKDEMCWSTENNDQTKQNFLDNLKVLNTFQKRVEYTSFNVRHFYHVTNSGGAWEYIENTDGTAGIPISTCSWPSRTGFVVTYELCFKDWTDQRACIMLLFQLDNDGKLLFMTESRDINMRDDTAYTKYSPIYYPLSANNTSYNPLHLFVEGAFNGHSLKTIEESVDSWLNR